MNEPLITVELLDKLVKFGFTDEFFDIVHHFKGETIEHYRKNCIDNAGRFQAGGTNEQVQRRLSIVLNSYTSGGFSNTEAFRLLAHASVIEVPYVE